MTFTHVLNKCSQSSSSLRDTVPLARAMKRMDTRKDTQKLKGISLSERCQSEKPADSMIPTTGHSRKSKTKKIDRREG